MTRKPKTSECVYTTSDKAKEEKYGGSLFFSIAPFPTPPLFFPRGCFPTNRTRLGDGSPKRRSDFNQSGGQ